MVNFANLSFIDLINTTIFLHKVKPELKSMYVVGIEQAKPDDRSVVFHMINESEINKPFEMRNVQQILLSAEFILEHPHFKQKEKLDDKNSNQ